MKKLAVLSDSTIINANQIKENHSMTLQEEWRGGFTLHFDSNPIFDEEWLLDDRHVKEDELRFLGYDANMCALPNLSTVPEKHRREVVQQASLKFKNVNADIWLDDCKIKVKSNDR